MNILRVAGERRELLYNLVSRELKIRYRGSALGFLWSVLIPLFMAMIYVVFLRLLGGRQMPVAEIIIGVFAWQFTVQSVNSGLSSITGSVNLVKKVHFPRVILPLAATLANLVNYLLSLVVQFPVVMVLLHLTGQHISVWTWALPAVVVVHLLFNLALALFMAGANVYFRDTQHLVGVILSAWFFVSPVMYNLEYVEHMTTRIPWIMDLYLLNPIAGIITAYRALIMPDTAMPCSASLWGALALVVLLLLLSLRVFDRQEKDFADLL